MMSSRFVKHTLRGLATATLLLSAARLNAATIQLDKEPVSPTSHYNILLFENLQLAFTGSIETVYDDNIDTDETDGESGLGLIPRLTMAVDWPLTPRIHFGTGISVGFETYPGTDVEDVFFVGMDEGIDTSAKVDFYLGDSPEEHVLQLADDFSRESDVLEVSDADDDYILTRNRLSLTYWTPLDPYVDLTLEAARQDTWANQDAYEYQDNVRYSVDTLVSWQANKQLRIGPYLRYENTDYDQEQNNDRDSYEAGASFVYRRESGFTIDGSLGYEILEIDETPIAMWGRLFELVYGPPPDEDEDGLTGQLGVRFATSKFLSHHLRALYDRGQDLLEYGVNYSRELTLMYGFSWNAIKNLTVRGDVSFRNIDESDHGENADVWRLGGGTTYELTRASRVAFRYEWTDRDSDQAGDSYDRNRFSVKLIHDF